MTLPVNSGSSQPRSREELKSLYQQSIGGTFFRQMMKALRSTTGQAAYFNGGQAEKIFQGQLDELLIEKLADTSGAIFSDAMFDQQFPALADGKQADGKQAAQDLTGPPPAEPSSEDPQGGSTGLDTSV